PSCSRTPNTRWRGRWQTTMATRRKAEKAAGVYAVRKLGRGFFLYKSEFGWRWDGTGKRTEMTREEAEEMAARLGGVVVVGPDWMPPGKTKPKRPRFSKELAPGEAPDKATRLRILVAAEDWRGADRKSTRLNSSHVKISYAVFCLKKKKKSRKKKTEEK